MKLKNHAELGITEIQYKNLAKLITFVRQKVEPPKFNIKNYNSHSEHDDDGIDLKDRKYTCGTTACFAGYGPLAGIEPSDEVEDWGEYTSEAFDNGDMGVWYLLFANDHANNKEAACRRGAWFLMNGLPATGNLRTWEAPESFRPSWKAIEKLANS